MRYIIAFFVALGLLFVVLILLFNNSGKPKVVITPKTLDSYASTDAQVVMTIDGPVNASEVHEQVRVAVDSNDVTFEQIQGYDGNAVNSQSYANTENSYKTLLLSLAHAGFTQGNNDPNARDERGFCALGDRFVFELRQDGRDIERYWATSCGKPQTYLGSLNLTVTLFQKQVPNYSDLTQKLSL